MIRVGIAGFGKIGQLRFQILSKHEGFEVVSILEKNKTKRGEKKYNASSTPLIILLEYCVMKLK